MRVPNTLWINDDHRTVSALIEASRFVDANLFFQAAFNNLFAQLVANIDAPLPRAYLSGRAHKYMFFEDFHMTACRVAPNVHYIALAQPLPNVSPESENRAGVHLPC